MNSKTFNIICNKYESSLRNHITQNFQNFSIISIKQIIINSFFSKFNFGVDELVIYWGCSGNYLNLKIYTFHVVSNIIYWQPTSPDSGEVTVSKIKSNFVWSSSLSETQSKAKSKCVGSCVILFEHSFVFFVIMTPFAWGNFAGWTAMWPQYPIKCFWVKDLVLQRVVCILSSCCFRV